MDKELQRDLEIAADAIRNREGDWLSELDWLIDLATDCDANHGPYF